MKQLLPIILCTIIIAGCNTSVKNNQGLSADKSVSEKKVLPGYFGKRIGKDGAVSTADLLSRLSASDSVHIKVSAEILATCKVKGCWMKVAMPDSDPMRVTFKDYAFFVPKSGVEGKTAVMEGYAKKVITDVETLRHYAKDAGKSQQEIAAITTPKEEITFEASGVVIE